MAETNVYNKEQVKNRRPGRRVNPYQSLYKTDIFTNISSMSKRSTTVKGRAKGLRKWSTLEMESEESHPLAVGSLWLYSVKKSHRVQRLGKDTWWDDPTGEREAAQKFSGAESFLFSWWRYEGIHLEILLLGYLEGCCPIRYQLTGFWCGNLDYLFRHLLLHQDGSGGFSSWFMWCFLGVAK